MSMEINTSGAEYRCKEFFPATDLLRWAAERNIGLTFGSDAHDPHRVGDGFTEAIHMARAMGPGHTIVTILCDHGSRYQSKIFNRAFLEEKGLPAPAWM